MEGAEPSGNPAVAGRGGVVHVVVQRCTRARLLVDAANDTWVDTGRGLVFFVSFAQGAAQVDFARIIRQVAKSLLTAPLSTSDKWTADHTDAESVAALCQKGEPQGVLVVPQASLVSKLEAGDKYLKYHHQCSREDADKLFHCFVDVLAITARELIAGSAKPKHDAASYQALKAKRVASSLISPDQLFRVGEYEGKYAQYDERGVPTHSADGAELPKSAAKKLEKVYAGQVKKYEKAVVAGEVGLGGASALCDADKGSAELAAKDAEIAEISGVAELPPVPDGMCLPEIHHGTFGGRQGFEMVSSGPFTHQFVF